MFGRIVIGLALTLSVGCQFNSPTRPKGSPKPLASKGPGAVVQFAALTETPRLIDQSAPGELVSNAQMVGKVKLISDKGSGVISNNTGNLISNNSGNLISDKGSSLISNNSGNLVSKVKYETLATEATQEALLADAIVEILDATGHILVDAKKKPLTATTDANGQFSFKGLLPKENLILRIRLFNGGQLYALLAQAKDGAEQRTLDLDTASTLGAAYVLDKYVQNRQDVFNKLPAVEADALHAAMQSARTLLPKKAPSYKPADMVAAAETLRTQDASLNTRLESIKALLLAGQSNLGAGLSALEVALSVPSSVAGDAAGNLYIAELPTGRIRKVDAAGKISLFAGGSVLNGDALDTPQSLLMRKDGTLLIADSLGHKIRQVAPDGKISTFAGTGDNAQTAPGAALDIAMSRPYGLAEGPDGSIYVSENPKGISAGGRVLRIDPAGQVTEIPGSSDPEWGKAELSGIAVTTDGTIYVAQCRTDALWQRTPEGVWSVRQRDLRFKVDARLLADDHNGVYVAVDYGNQILYLESFGPAKVIAGTGTPGAGGDGGPAVNAQLNTPSGMWMGPGGKLYVAEGANGLVRMIDLAAQPPTIRTVAGTTSQTQVGNATSISINSPGGMALDSQGRIVLAEVAGNVIKRLENGRLVTIAGSITGRGPEIASSLTAQFDTPGGIAYDSEGNLYVPDSGNARVRKIDRDGQVTTVAGKVEGAERPALAKRMPALGAQMARPLFVAVGPNNIPYWTDNEKGRVWRLMPDGYIELVAGRLDESAEFTAEGVANDIALNFPTSIAFDAKGDLFIADVGNFVIRKVTGLTGAEPWMTTFAGRPPSETIGMLIDRQGLANDGLLASEALMIGPGALVFDQQGNLYCGELGTTRLGALGATINLPTGLLPRIGTRITRIAPDGRIKTIAGVGTTVLNNPDSDDFVHTPLCILIDEKGQLIIADAGTNQLKLLPVGSF